MKGYLLALCSLVWIGYTWAEIDLVLSPYEQNTHKIITALTLGDLTEAQDLSLQLVKDFPNYPLPRLLLADFYAQRSGYHLPKKARQKVAFLYDELKLRWNFSFQEVRLAHNFAQQVVLPDLNEWYLIDLAKHRLYVIRRGQLDLWQIEKAYYVSLGQKGAGKGRAGDKRTPLGVYEILQTKLDQDLPDIYGVGALTLNYPNPWDKMNGRTGYGIWLHGVPHSSFTRAPLATQGCVALNNQEMQVLLNRPWNQGKLVVILPSLDEVPWKFLHTYLTPMAKASLTHLDKETRLVPFLDQRNLYLLRMQLIHDQWHHSYYLFEPQEKRWRQVDKKDLEKNWFLRAKLWFNQLVSKQEKVK